MGFFLFLQCLFLQLLQISKMHTTSLLPILLYMVSKQICMSSINNKSAGKVHASLPLVNKSNSDNSNAFSKEKFKFLLDTLPVSVLKLPKNSSLKGICLAFQCLRTAPVPFQMTSPLVKSCIPLVSPLQQKTVLCSMEQITPERHRKDRLLPQGTSALLSRCTSPGQPFFPL